MIGIGIYAGPVIASTVFIPIADLSGKKRAWMAYIVIAILTMLLIPDRELALFFVFFGWYPIALDKINTLKSGIARILVKLVIYSVLIYLMYGIIMGLLGIDSELFETKIYNFILAAAGFLIFLMLDIVYSRLEQIWKLKLKKKI